jgi:hypothetical protein
MLGRRRSSCWVRRRRSSCWVRRREEELILG